MSGPHAEKAKDSVGLEDASLQKNRTPSADHHDKVIAYLAEIGRRPDVDPLERSHAALRAVVAYFDSSLDISSRHLTRPVHSLIHALSDTLRGGQPALLRPRRRGKGPPQDQSFSSVQGALAGALEVLVRAGMPLQSAARWVTAKANSHGIRDRKGQNLSASQVIAWRARAGDDLPATGSAAFKKVSSRPSADQEAAKLYVKGVILALADTGLGAD